MAISFAEVDFARDHPTCGLVLSLLGLSEFESFSPKSCHGGFKQRSLGPASQSSTPIMALERSTHKR
ncbi:hypothetical protein N7453_007820 [Penicillium expansum]|nr:hypothetical protein N7453_007820 [Penicillium expansum]